MQTLPKVSHTKLQFLYFLFANYSSKSTIDFKDVSKII